MFNIAICIPTYKRPLMLKKLILSIIGCKINKSLIKDIKIIVVDNDVAKTAELVINELKEKLCTKSEINYFNFPIKGLSNVRNESIKSALLLNPDFLVFVDDDEYVTSEWLNELVKTIIANKGDLTMGPVISIMGNKISDSISYWLQRPNYLNNTKLGFIRTGNLIINVKSLIKFAIWFDKRFNTTGGEDFYFGVQMINKGATVYWAAKAIVYEPVPESRANIKWLLKRIYREATTYTYILKLEKEYLRLMKKILVSLIYIITGIGAIILLILPIKKRYWGILTLTEGIGGLAGFFSILYNEYK